MRIVKSYNKQNGVVYVYEVLGHTYDKEKKFTRSKRRLIGKIDPETGEIVPTGSRARKGKTDGLAIKSDGKVDYQLHYLEAAAQLQQTRKEFEKLKAENAVLQQKYDRLAERMKSLLALDETGSQAAIECLEKSTHQVPVYKLSSEE